MCVCVCARGCGMEFEISITKSVIGTITAASLVEVLERRGLQWTLGRPASLALLCNGHNKAWRFTKT